MNWEFCFFLIKKNKHSFSHNIWIGGTITNFKFCFLKCFLFIINKQLHFRLKKKKLFFSTLNRFSYLKNFKFFNFLFFKLLILNYNNFKNLNFNIVTFKKIFNKYWRFFFFFKNFSVILKKIDCCIIFNAKNNLIPIYEFSRRKIPTIGVIDTNTPYYLNITYPIVSNDDSILLLIFFTNIFLNSFNIGSINFFFFMIKKKKKIIF